MIKWRKKTTIYWYIFRHTFIQIQMFQIRFFFEILNGRKNLFFSEGQKIENVNFYLLHELGLTENTVKIAKNVNIETQHSDLHNIFSIFSNLIQKHWKCFLWYLNCLFETLIYLTGKIGFAKHLQNSWIFEQAGCYRAITRPKRWGESLAVGHSEKKVDLFIGHL